MREYLNGLTGEKVLVKQTDIMHKADPDKLLGKRDSMVYLTYKAWKNAPTAFFVMCEARNITIAVLEGVM